MSTWYKNLEELLGTWYPIEIHFIEGKTWEEDHFFAFLPDFGYAACSATGDCIDEALFNLTLVKAEVLTHFHEEGKDIPKPSKPPFER